MLTWIKTKWAQFEAWLNTWFPGFKTYSLLALGTVGNTAASLQEFATGLPTTKYISTEVLAGVSAVLYVLAFWLKGLGDRVEAKKETI